jgi:purine-binding chemotaxis protein CheW
MSAAKDDVSSGKWATFLLAGEMFAIRVEDVREVLMDQPLAPVPLAPAHIVGLLNLRGQIISAIDLRRRLGFPPREPGQAPKLLVLSSRGTPVSVVVDEIGDVLTLPQADWRPPPDTLAASHRDFVSGICPIEGHMVLGVKVAKLSADDERPEPSGARA